MAKQTYAKKVDVAINELQSLLLERFQAEGYSKQDSQDLMTGYIHNFMINLITDHASQKQTLASIESRKEMQREKIHEARMRSVTKHLINEFNPEFN